MRQEKVKFKITSGQLRLDIIMTTFALLNLLLFYVLVAVVGSQGRTLSRGVIPIFFASTSPVETK